jgi:hypothetical protein
MEQQQIPTKNLLTPYYSYSFYGSYTVGAPGIAPTGVARILRRSGTLVQEIGVKKQRKPPWGSLRV